jgi:hypothetical protein
MKYATKLVRYLALGVLLHRASATVGFTTYKEIDEGKDNSGEIAYSGLFSRSSTLFLYIQITPDGADHADIIDDFKTLARNFGSQGVSVIPRVRYGWPNNTIATEPEESILMNDVSTFATVFQDITGTINIPVIQAGFLGEWGEWHVGLSNDSTLMTDGRYRLTTTRMVNIAKLRAWLILQRILLSRQMLSIPFFRQGTRWRYDIPPTIRLYSTAAVQ